MFVIHSTIIIVVEGDMIRDKRVWNVLLNGLGVMMTSAAMLGGTTLMVRSTNLTNNLTIGSICEITL